MELDSKMQFLIMVGAAQAAKCGPCLEHAIAMAKEAGCGGGVIAQALAVGTKVREGSHAMLTDQAEEQLAEILDALDIRSAVPKDIYMDLGDATCPCSKS